MKCMNEVTRSTHMVEYQFICLGFPLDPKIILSICGIAPHLSPTFFPSASFSFSKLFYAIEWLLVGWTTEKKASRTWMACL